MIQYKVEKGKHCEKKKCLMNGVGSPTAHLTALHHWLSFKGKSRCPLIHLEKYGYMIASLLGRRARWVSKSDFPDLVTQET
jgi:hypothetical protein